MTVTSSPNPSVAGQPVTLIARSPRSAPDRAPPPAPSPSPLGSTQLGTENLSDGVATLTTTTLPTGTDTITAVYSGDTNFIAPASVTFSQVVTPGDHVRHDLGLEYQSVRAPADHVHGDRLGGLRTGHSHRQRDLRDQQRYRPRHGHADLRRGHADGQRPAGRRAVDHGGLLGRFQLPRQDLSAALHRGRRPERPVRQPGLRGCPGHPRERQLHDLDRAAQRRLFSQARRHPASSRASRRGSPRSTASTSRCWAARRPGTSSDRRWARGTPRRPRSTSTSSARGNST